MRRPGFICDDCGDEHRNREPAAILGADWELCEDCYEEYLEGRR